MKQQPIGLIAAQVMDSFKYGHGTLEYSEARADAKSYTESKSLQNQVAWLRLPGRVREVQYAS